VTTPFATVAKQCGTFPAAMEKAAKRATEKASLAAKDAVIAAYRQDFHNGRLSHMGKGGTPFAASYTVKPKPEGVVGIVTARGGATFLADLGSHKHPSGFNTGKGARRRNRKVVRKTAGFNAIRAGFGLAALAPVGGQHPPVKPIRGGHHFRRGIKVAEKVAPAVYATEMGAALGKHFK
jgi:hypothetical protein